MDSTIRAHNMGIKLLIFFLMAFCGNLFSQKVAFYTALKAGALFGTQANDEMILNEVSDVEYITLSRLGNIRYSMPVFDLEIGCSSGRNTFGVFAGTNTVQSGNRMFFNYNSSGRVEYQVYSGYSRFEAGIFYGRENLIPWEFRNRVQFSLSFTSNTASEALPSSINLGSAVNGLPDLYVRDSSVYPYQKRAGINLSVSYQIPVMTARGKNLFDLRFEYTQGLRVVNKTYYSIGSEYDQYNLVRADSRGSSFVIALSRNFFIRKNEADHSNFN